MNQLSEEGYNKYASRWLAIIINNHVVSEVIDNNPSQQYRDFRKYLVTKRLMFSCIYLSPGRRSRRIGAVGGYIFFNPSLTQISYRSQSSLGKKFHFSGSWYDRCITAGRASQAFQHSLAWKNLYEEMLWDQGEN